MHPVLFDISILNIFLHMGVATLLGLVVGAERSMAGKHAGMRTFALVSLGSCLFIVTSIIVTGNYLGKVPFDPMRVAAGIITGVGFIGAGLIVLRENMLRGLTTAAGLWVSSGIGIAAGFGLYVLATFAAIFTVVVFSAVWLLENKVKTHFAHQPPTVVDKLVGEDELIDE